jgi:DNA polymerase/3'-5' exonuclease PolX
MHYTPTYAISLNQVERWFAPTTQRAIRRGSFKRVRELVCKIDHYVTTTTVPSALSSGPRPLIQSSAFDLVHGFFQNEGAAATLLGK